MIEKKFNIVVLNSSYKKKKELKKQILLLRRMFEKECIISISTLNFAPSIFTINWNITN